MFVLQMAAPGCCTNELRPLALSRMRTTAVHSAVKTLHCCVNTVYMLKSQVLPISVSNAAICVNIIAFFCPHVRRTPHCPKDECAELLTEDDGTPVRNLLLPSILENKRKTKF